MWTNAALIDPCQVIDNGSTSKGYHGYWENQPQCCACDFRWMIKLKSMNPGPRTLSEMVTLRLKFRTGAIHTSRLEGCEWNRGEPEVSGTKGEMNYYSRSATACIRQLCVIKNIWCWGMGGGGFGVRGSIIHIIKTLAFLQPFSHHIIWWSGNSVNQIVFACKTGRRTTTDLLSMEQLALILQNDVIPDELHGPWKFTRSCLEKAEPDSDRYFYFLHCFALL